MTRLLRWIFTGDDHKHKWGILEKENRQIKHSVTGQVSKQYDLYHLQCEICGDLKFKESI